MVGKIGSKQPEPLAQQPLMAQKKSLSPETKARLKTAAKVGVALVILAALAGTGTLAIYKTVGFHAAGEWIKNQATAAGHAITQGWHQLSTKVVELLNSGHYQVKDMLISAAAGVGGGILLTALGYKAIKSIQHRLEERKLEKAREAAAHDASGEEDAHEASGEGEV